MPAELQQPSDDEKLYYTIYKPISPTGEYSFLQNQVRAIGWDVCESVTYQVYTGRLKCFGGPEL